MKLSRRTIILVTLTLLIISFLFMMSVINLHFSSQGAFAYPAPDQPVPTTQNPYPAPNSPPPSTPDLPKELPENFLPTHYIYLPIIRRDPPARFSVAGASNEAWVLQVVPNGLQIDPYSWDRLPNNNSSIQMIRACTYYRNKTISYNPTWHYEFSDWYWPSRVGLRWDNQQYVLIKNFCWDPLNEKVAQIVYQAGCPYYDPELAIPIDGSVDISAERRNQRKPCLDTEISAIPDTGESEFRAIVQNNPNWIWLIGNEPDNISQDAFIDSIQIGNGVITNTVSIGGPNAYAVFFKEIYTIMEEEISPQSKLVFCQSTIAWSDPERPNMGLPYCQQAFTHLRTLGYGAEDIYALATHLYMHESEVFGGTSYSWGRLLDGETQPIPGDSRTVLELAVGKWEEYLQEFEAWAESEGMGHKPLWLTEYGSLAAWCFETHTGGVYEAGGISCQGIGQNNVFYGRNSHEGLWGLQTGQMAYLARPDNNWQAAWWFVSRMGDWNNDGFCDQTAWLWGSDFDCNLDNNNLSRAGETHEQVLDCLLNGQNCSAPGVENAESNLQIEASTWPPLNGPYCKADGNLLCLPHRSPPPPTPIPTPVACNCSGSNLENGNQCPDIICPDGE